MSIQNSSTRSRSLQPTDFENFPRASDHAKLRWLERSSNGDLSVQQAWLESCPIEYQDSSGKTRLHPPSRTILLAKNKCIITVLHAAYEEYGTDHLAQCEDCEFEFQPQPNQDACPWCSQETEESDR